MQSEKHGLGPSPGNRRYPHHRISIQSAGECWQACHGKRVLAISEHALLLSETGYPDVVYFPPDSVCFEWLQSSDSASTCPFKGAAAYLKLKGQIGDVAWYYPEAYDEVSEIAGYVAFYPQHISIERKSCT